MSKKITSIALGSLLAASGATAVAMAVAAPAEAAACENIYRITDGGWVDPDTGIKYIGKYENESWDDRDGVIQVGLYVRARSGLSSRPSGWTPIYKVAGSENGTYVSVLSGANDANDFVRTSGLKWIKCG